MSTSLAIDGLPIIDLTVLGRSEADFGRIAYALDRACAEFGFFYVIGHGIDPSSVAALETLARRFFALPEAQKLAIAMTRGGRAWRGYFPLGGELTSGRPDRKEGIYFGTELGPQDPRVQGGLPLHGANLYPDLPQFRERLLTYLDTVTALGQQLLAAIAYGLGLSRDYFLERYTRDPTVLFRIFNYPPADIAEALGVGEHTDYGLLTLLRQDEVGGLEVRHGDRWMAAPPVTDSFVCNVGDMLERLTAGRYVSALHRVRNVTSQSRISMPLFLDPGFEAVLEPIPLASGRNNWSVGSRTPRWDSTDLATISGTYGDYLLGKVAKVFPDLGRRHLT
jgi:isopenicillin N synthase-like dioxygenase